MNHLVQALVFALLWLLPPLWLAKRFWGDWLERWLLATGATYLIHSLSSLLLGYLWPTAPLVLRLLLALLVLVAAIFSSDGWRPDLPTALTSAPFVLAFALALRLPWLGYKEWQGDEAIPLTRAAAILTGDRAEFFLHQKGPIEIVVPLTAWGITGQLTELWARLPFTWAAACGVLTVYLLGKRWFGARAGLAAGLIFAVVGFAIAFGRIVQYQSFVVFWGLLAVVCAVRYCERGRRTDLLWTAAFLAIGLLAHYDAVLVGPAILALILPRWRQGIDWLLATGVGAAILGLFYVPFMRSPTFQQTLSYLVNDRVGVSDEAGAIGWSGGRIWQMLTLYNDSYFVIGCWLLAFVGIIWFVRRGHWPQLILTLTPILFYTLVVTDPRTHVYTTYAGVALAGGFVLAKAAESRLRWIMVPLAALLLASSTNYVWQLFVDHTVERQRNWSDFRPNYYPVTWQEPPQFGLFGFPYQAGWRAISQLDGVALPYASNEEQETTDFYLKNGARTHCTDFGSFMLAKNVQDEIRYDPAWLEGKFLTHVIEVNDRPKIELYSDETTVIPETVEASNLTIWWTPDEVAPDVPQPTHALDVVLGERQARLVGYDIVGEFRPNTQVVVTLYWEALAPFDRNFQTFVHLFDGQQNVAQHDGAPECDINPTTRWEPGQFIPDPHIIDIPADAPTNQPLTLRSGMYGLLDLQRLSVPASADNVINLTEITLEPSN